MSETTTRFKLWYYSQPKALRFLLSVNVVIYLLWQVLFIHFEPTQRFFLTHLALNPNLPSILYQPWQLLTYAFLHLEPGLGGLLHILFNMLWMLWIGRDYEPLFGPGRIYGIYVMGAAGGALLTVVLHALLPGVAVFGGIVHGASGAVLALMTMVAIHQPEKQIGLMFIGVVRLIHVVVGFIVLDILFLSAGGTSVSAHLGGVLTGFLCGKMLLNGVDPTAWARVFVSSGRSGGGGSFGGSRGSGGRGQASGSDSSFMHRLENLLAERKEKKTPGNTGSAKIYRMDVSAREAAKGEETDVDRILDKISETGYDSLTKREKEILLKESGKKS